MLGPEGGVLPIGGGSTKGSDDTTDGLVVVERSSLTAIGEESQMVGHEEFLVEADRDFALEGGLVTKVNATRVEQRAVEAASDASVELLDLPEGCLSGGQVEWPSATAGA